jgi:hypothetical protein
MCLYVSYRSDRFCRSASQAYRYSYAEVSDIVFQLLSRCRTLPNLNDAAPMFNMRHRYPQAHFSASKSSFLPVRGHSDSSRVGRRSLRQVVPVRSLTLSLNCPHWTPLMEKPVLRSAIDLLGVGSILNLDVVFNNREVIRYRSCRSAICHPIRF